MDNSKVIQVLKKFSNKELEHFADFTNSPYFNKNATVHTIYLQLKERLNKKTTQSLSYDDLLKSNYSKKEQRIEKLRNDLSVLYKLIKQFLAYQNLEQTDFTFDLAMLKAAQSKQETQLFEKESVRIKLKLDSQDHNSFASFQFYDLQDEHFQHKRLRKFDENIQHKMDALDEYYIGLKIREACEMLNRNAIYQQKCAIRLAEIFDIISENNEIAQFKASTQIYFLVYNMLKSNERADYLKLVDSLENSDIPKSEMREFFIHAQNFCTRKINAGESSYFEDLFELFKQLIDKELVLVDNQIPHTTYKNIVTVALNVQQHKWTLDFIEAYAQYLKPNISRSAYSYNLAKYNYQVGDFETAIDLLQSVDYEDNYYQIDARYLLLTIFYETNEHEALLYQIDAFKLYLKRNKNINIKTRDAIIGFLKMLRRTAVLRQRKMVLALDVFESRLAKLKADFEANNQLPYRNWMQKIMKELAA